MSGGPGNGGAVMIEVDHLDRTIIRTLREDPRASYKAIADRLGISHNTVKTRLDRLVREHVIRLAVIADPPKVGLAVSAHIGVSVQPAHIQAVSRLLGGRREVSFLGLTLGDHDILAIANFESNEKLFEFVNRFVGNLEGVTSVDTTVVCQALKWDPDDTAFLALLDGDSAPDGGTRTHPG
ncbi:MAG: Lrp/AsnC family transcriptional regulator [Dehalococcoidia bacterium]|jgi:Lrp/AsnC family transcriptional regulator for asnA, asnC and gidA